jgi:hypothetical protein
LTCRSCFAPLCKSSVFSCIDASSVGFPAKISLQSVSANQGSLLSCLNDLRDVIVAAVFTLDELECLLLVDYKSTN